MRTFEGLLDRASFPGQLTGRVVDPSPDPRIHGYAVQADLGHNAGFVDVFWLALTGELPRENEREALSRALAWLAPLHVGEGPAHAAVLAKVAGAPEEVVPAVATLALGQYISAELKALSDFFSWLLRGEGSVPEGIAEEHPSSEQRAAWSRLSEETARWFGADQRFTPDSVWKRVPAAYALLHRLGVRDTARLLAFATWARLPVLLAEAACVASGSIMRYPTHMPMYQYVEGT